MVIQKCSVISINFTAFYMWHNSIYGFMNRLNWSLHSSFCPVIELKLLYLAKIFENGLFQGGKLSKRLFYLSVPPNVFVDVVRCASHKASSKNGWTRVIVEKPFGRDSESSSELTRCLKQYLAEEQIFRCIWLFLS